MPDGSRQIIPIPFHQDTLYAVKSCEVTHVAIKEIAERLGLDWSAQWRRLQRNPILKDGIAIMAMPSAGGEQETTVLRLELLNGWLLGIDVNRVAEPYRPMVLTYQRECYAVLHQHFFSNRDEAVRSAATWQRLMDELDRRQEFQNQQIAELTTQLQKVNQFVAAFGKDPIATVGKCVKGVVNKRLTATEQEHGKRFTHLDDGVDELRDEAVFQTFTQILKAFGVSGVGSNGSRGKSFHAHMDDHIKTYPDRATHRQGTGSDARYSKALVREFWGTFTGKALLMKILGPQQAGFDFGTGRPTSH